MYAIMKTGGKQYTVKEGDLLRVEKLNGEIGQELVLNEVLLIADAGKYTIGKPVIAGASVTAEIVDQDRAKKILVMHRRRRKGFKKLNGHRQPYTEIRIKSIAS